MHITQWWDDLILFYYQIPPFIARTLPIPRFLARVRCANTWLRVVFPDGMCIIIFCPYKSIAAAETNSVLGSGWQVSDMGSWDGFHVMLQNRGIQCSFNLPMMAMRFVAPLKVLGGKNSNEKNCSFFSIFSLTMSMSLCGLDSPLSPVCCAMILVVSHCRWNHKHALRLPGLHWIKCSYDIHHQGLTNTKIDSQSTLDGHLN